MHFNENSKKGPFFNFYWHFLMKAVAKTPKLESGMTVLDFGASEQQLRKYLPKDINYIAYDINPAFKPDISSLSQLKQRVGVVFASNIFEHLSEAELRKAAKQILALKPRFVVVATPRETSWLSILVRFVNRFTFEHGWEHKLGWKQITRILSEYFEPCAVKNFYFLQWIVLLKPKKSG